MNCCDVSHYLTTTSAPYPATAHWPDRERKEKCLTYREIDQDLVQCRVVGHDGPLHLAAPVGDVHSLAGHQVGEIAKSSKAGANQVCFVKFTYFSAIVESDRVAVFSLPVRLTSFDGLDDGRIKSAIVTGGNNSCAQN